MANLKGLESVVSQLRIQRTNLVGDLKRVDGALSALGSLNGSSNHAPPRRTMSAWVAGGLQPPREPVGQK